MRGRDSLQCPVCRARFRGSAVCSRCGANLEPLMLLVGKALQLRQRAARAVLAGDYEAARSLAAKAQAICSSSRGSRLEWLSGWLAEQDAPRAKPGSAGQPEGGPAEEFEPRSRRAFPRSGLPLTKTEALTRGLLLAGIAGLGWTATTCALAWFKSRG